MSRKRIYLDNATTTPVAPDVMREMARFFAADFGNPGSIHAEGVVAKKAVTEARHNIARLLHAHADEIIFTSGGTEANNLAIAGFIHALHVRGRPYKKMHAITSVIEHASVLECFHELERRGVAVTYMPVNGDGIVMPKSVREALRLDTVLVSLMYANNEIGTIQPVAKIARVIRDFRQRGRLNLTEAPFPFLHTDASQAPQYLDCNRERLGVDMLTLDGQKMYGPKGVGALYAKRGTPLAPLFKGGGQERGLRPGTENVPLIAGFAKALEMAVKTREVESARLTALRDFLIGKVRMNTAGAVLNGSATERLPHNANFSFPGVDTEFLVLQLDAAGIACSTKSACKEGERESHVVAALGDDPRRATSTIRFSLGRATKRADISFLCAQLERILKKP